MEQSVNIIYILGSPHGGSTLINLILGAHSQIAPLGEMIAYDKHFAEPEKRRCSCGDSLVDCGYWNEVRRRVEAGGDHWPLNLTCNSSFDKNLITLLRNVLEVAEKSWVCDSSRDLSRLMQYESLPQCNVFTVLVVRDPRAVAFSMQKKYKKRKTFRKQLATANRRFWAQRAACKALPRHFVMRYESLVSNPEKEIRALMEAIGLPFENEQLRFWEATQHIYSGNRLLQRGDNKILHDIGYLERIHFYRWIWSTLRSIRLLQLMRYPLSKKGVRSMSTRHSRGWGH